MNITPAQMQEAFIERITLGNKEAHDFLQQYGAFINIIDDVVDEKTDVETRLETMVLAREVYTHPFFLKHFAALKQIDVNTTNAYADSVAFERSDVEWKKQWSDHYRHFGSEMALAVAYIVAGGGRQGHEHMRSLSQEMRTSVWAAHHDNKGKVT